MRIPNKFNGYSADNRRLYNMGGGGGPNTTYSQTSNIPEYARPYVEQMLGATQRQLFTGQTDAGGKFTPTGFNNYMPYGATYNGRDAQGNPIYTNTAMDQARAAVAPQGIGQLAFDLVLPGLQLFATWESISAYLPESIIFLAILSAASL